MNSFPENSRYRIITLLAAIYVTINGNVHVCQGFTNPSHRQRWVDYHHRNVLQTRYPQPILCSSGTDTISDPPSEIDRLRGVLVLTTVPVAWGTFEVAVRYVYAIEPAIPAFLFSLLYYTVAATALLLLLIALSSSVSHGGKQKDATSNRNEPKLLDVDVIDSSSSALESKEKDNGLPIRGGMELGTYLFVGNLLQVVGLQTVNSDRAAFLLQLTTVFVPLMQAIIDRSLQTIGVRTWGACALALIGVGIMGLDDTKSIDFTTLETISNQFQWSPGDSLIVLAAVAYTFHCIRLEGYAKSTSAVKLATCKAFTETALSAIAVIAVVTLAFITNLQAVFINQEVWSFFITSGEQCIDYISSLKSSITSDNMTPSLFIPAILAILWTGLVPVAYTILAQSFGQSRVRPVTANLIYTIQPICTAIFAFLLLQETLGPAGFFGGTLIGAAVLLVVMDTSSEAEGN